MLPVTTLSTDTHLLEATTEGDRQGFLSNAPAYVIPVSDRFRNLIPAVLPRTIIQPGLCLMVNMYTYIYFTKDIYTHIYIYNINPKNFN